MLRFVFLVVCLQAEMLVAEPMNAEQFDAYTAGKTLYFGQDGQAYGAETYLPGRRVRWSFLDGECKDGRWYQDGPAICFVYEDSPDPHCWMFRRGPAGLIAEFLEDGDRPELYEAYEADEPLQCLGPRIGV